jgi:hypothetical protein
MEIPFLKNKSKTQGSIAQTAENLEETYKKQMLEHAAKEFMESIHRKDIKSMRESLRAICQYIRG